MKRPSLSYAMESVESLKVFVGKAACLIFFVLVILEVPSARAEDLMEVYTLAREKDPTFQSESYQHEASPEILKQAYSELLPLVSGDASYQRRRQEIVETDVAIYGDGISRYPNKGYTLTLTQPVLKYSSIMRVLQAKEEVKRADLEFEAAKQDLVLRVAEAYMRALEAKDDLAFTLAEEAAIKRHYELARERYKSGLSPITDFHDARARLANTTAQRVASENRLDDALEALAEVAGQEIKNLSELKPVPIRKEEYTGTTTRGRGDTAEKSGQETAWEGMPLVGPDPDDINEWIDAAVKQNLEVEVQRQTTLVTEREVERQKAGHWPTINLVGRVYRDVEGGSLFGGDSDVITREAGLELNVPIFQGLYVLSKTREAKKLYKAAQEDLEKNIRAVKRQSRAAFLGVKSAIKNTEAFRQSVVSNHIALEAKKEGFRSGLFPSLAVLDAERDLHQAKREHARAQYEYILNRLLLKKAVGTLKESDLGEINRWLK